jgi:hypothetical protein
VGQKRNAYKILLRKTEGKTPLGRPRRVWADNIKMDLRDIGWRVWTGLGYRPVARSCEYDIEPSGYIKFWEFLE